MGIMVEPWYFAQCSHNISSTISATVGTNFTAGANNADGAAVSCISALAHDVHYITLSIGGISNNLANGQCLLDVLVDPAGGTSWSTLIADLVCGQSAVLASQAGMPSVTYNFPLFVKSGSSLGVQARTRHTSNITTGYALFIVHGNPSRPDMWWCGSSVESLGINAATSQGTDVTAGNSSAFGSWTTIGTSTQIYSAVQFGINGSDGTASATTYNWQLGYGSTALPAAHTTASINSTNETQGRAGMGGLPIFCNVPASTIWQIRGACSGTAEVYNAAVYGVY